MKKDETRNWRRYGTNEDLKQNGLIKEYLDTLTEYLDVLVATPHMKLIMNATEQLISMAYEIGKASALKEVIKTTQENKEQQGFNRRIKDEPNDWDK